MVQDVQDVIATALGGQTVTTTVEGRQRCDLRDIRDRDLGGYVADAQRAAQASISFSPAIT